MEENIGPTPQTHPLNVNALMKTRIPAHKSKAELDIGRNEPLQPTNQYATLQHQDRINGIQRAIGMDSSDIRGPEDPLLELQSEEPSVLREIFEQIGSQQVTKRQIELAPSWIVNDAFASQHESNWVGEYQEVEEHDIPLDANAVRYHVVHKVKTDEDGKQQLKERICPVAMRCRERAHQKGFFERTAHYCATITMSGHIHKL